MPGAAQHTAGIRHQRENMAGLDQITGPGVARHCRLNSTGTVRSRDASRHAYSGLNGEGKLGSEAGGVLLHHQWKTQLFAAVPGHRHANQATTKPGHEVDGFGRAMLSSHHEIALILAILVIHQYDHFALTDIFYDVFNAVQCHVVFYPCGAPANVGFRNILSL